MFVDEFVEMRWINQNKEHFEKFGYVFTKHLDTFLVRPEHLMPTSKTRVRFVCDVCGGKNQVTEEMKSKPFYKFHANDYHCCSSPECILKKIRKNKINKPKIAKNNIADNMTAALKDWSENNKMGPQYYSSGSNKGVWWRCPKRIKGHSDFLYPPKQKKQNSEYCPYCAGVSVNETNNIFTMDNSIYEEWDYDKNVGVDPHTVYHNNDTNKYWWRCKTCHNSWQKTPMRRKVRGCPWCVGRKVNVTNSLGLNYPNLLFDWDYEKNTISPFSIYKTARKRVWWKCFMCGHNWISGISRRTSWGETGCPACAKYGFSLNMPGNLYVVRWYDDNSEFLKIGITNKDVEFRIRQQKRKTDFNYEILHTFHFKDGLKCYNMEELIKNNFDVGIISKDLFGDGFTETTDIKNLDSILQLIESNM